MRTWHRKKWLFARETGLCYKTAAVNPGYSSPYGANGKTQDEPGRHRLDRLFLPEHPPLADHRIARRRWGSVGRLSLPAQPSIATNSRTTSNRAGGRGVEERSGEPGVVEVHRDALAGEGPFERSARSVRGRQIRSGILAAG